MVISIIRHCEESQSGLDALRFDERAQ